MKSEKSNSNLQNTENSQGIGEDEDGEKRPVTPDVSIPVDEDFNFKPLKETELILKYAPMLPKVDKQQETTPKESFSSHSLNSNYGIQPEPEWRLLLARYPSGPCYKLALDEQKDADQTTGDLIFSRNKAENANYHYDVLHAILEDFGLSFVEYQEKAEKLDLVHVRT